MPSSQDKAKIDKFCLEFEQAMDDNFNMPVALASLFKLVDFASVLISSDKKDAFIYAKLKVETFFNILGLSVKSKKEIPPEVERLIEERAKAKKNKDFKKADSIREDLKSKYKIIVSDTGSSFTFTEI